jgi:hypothetical protein
VYNRGRSQAPGSGDGIMAITVEAVYEDGVLRPVKGMPNAG